MAKPIQKTITENFHTDNTGSGNNQWLFTSGSDYVTGAWYMYSLSRQANMRNSANAATYSGSLRATCRKNNPSTESYWEYTGSWEDLGVPRGAVVNSFSLDYNYRWQCSGGKKRFAYNNIATFTGTDTGFGPVTLRDSGGTSLGTISSRVYGIDRDTASAQWKCYPDGVNDGRGIDGDNGWLTSTGTPISVSYPNANSSKTIKIRIPVLHPVTSAVFVGPGINSWVRMKIDKVVVTIQHSQGTSFFSF